jgi:hypothetical protein
MKGLAPPETLTGKVQRALSDEWSPAAWVVGRCEKLTYSEYGNVLHVLERLVREGRAESRLVRDIKFMSGGYYEYRRKQ